MPVPSAPPSAPRTARRRYLVAPGFQLKYTLILVTVGAALSLLFGAMMYQAHVETTQLMDLPEPYRAAVVQQDATLLWLVAGIALAMAVAMGLFGVLITHRVAGPLFVFSRYLGQLAEGRYPQVRPLRKHDELQGFYQVLRQALATLQDRDRRDGEELTRLADSLEAAATRLPQAAAELGAAAQTARNLGRRMSEAAASAPAVGAPAA